MPRTNAAAVQKVLDTTLASGDLDQFIADANAFVDAHLLGKGHSAALLETIERYVAADFATLKDPRILRGRRDKVTEEFDSRSQNEGGLLASGYGQRAIALDSSGTLKSLSKDEGFEFLAHVEG